MGSTSRSITHRWVVLGDFLYICIVLIHFSFWSFCFMDVPFLMSTFSLWKMSSESDMFVGFADGASQHTQRLAFASWVIFTPQG
jgi:hypothetical protein